MCFKTVIQKAELCLKPIKNIFTWSTTFPKEISGRFVLICFKVHFLAVEKITNRNHPSNGFSESGVTRIFSFQLIESETRVLLNNSEAVILHEFVWYIFELLAEDDLQVFCCAKEYFFCLHLVSIRNRLMQLV